MFYTYNLISIKTKKLYTGYTQDLKKRLFEHNNKKGGEYTSKNGPYTLIHYEAFLTEIEAKNQEKFYKSGYGKEVLKSKLKKTLTNLKK